MTIGSAAVEVVPDARGFWLRFQEQTRGGGYRAGAEAGREFQHGLNSATHDVKVSVRADTRDAERDIDRLRRDTHNARGSIVKDLLAFAPALVPLTGAAAAAGAELVALGGVAALALGGAKREIASVSPVGVQFVGVVSDLRGSLNQLQAVAARGVLPGVQASVAEVKAEIPSLTQVVAQQSVLLGSALTHLTGGLIGGFTTFEPVLDRVAVGVDHLAARFETFATGPGGAKFSKALINDFDEVGPVIDDVVSGLGHIIAAANGTGSIILTEFGAVARAIDAIPLPVLSAFITALTVSRVALLGFRAASAITGTVQSVSGALEGLRARFALSGLQAQAAAAQQAVASATVAGAAAAEAQQVAEAKLSEARANATAAAEALAAAESYVGASETVAESYIAEARAVLQATEAEELALSQSAAIATETARVKAGAAAAAADAYVVASEEEAAASKLSSASFLSILGPIGAVAGGLLLLPSLFGDTSDGAQEATSSVQTFSQALQQSKGVIDDNVRNTVAQAAAQAGLFAIGQKLGVSQSQVVDAIAKGGPAYDSFIDKLNHSVYGADLFRSRFDGLVKQFRVGADQAKQVAASAAGLGTAIDGISHSAVNADTAFSGFAKALQDYQKSEQTAADRGSLIGETLRAANGDAISYQNTINATAKANQQLVSDFKNLGKGVLDLKKGTLDYHNAAAGPVLGDLQALQDANVKAAAAVYQHFASTKGGAEAAANAFDVYKKNTQGALDTIGRRLGLSGAALDRFKNTYFGIKNAGDLKKKIELLGENKVLDALKGITEDLDILVGKKPLISVDANGKPAQHTVAGIQRAIDDIRQNRIPGITANTDNAYNKIATLQAEIRALQGKSVTITTVENHIVRHTTGSQSEYRKNGAVFKAAGGEVRGPGTKTSDSIPARLSNGEFVINATQYARNRPLVQAINAGAPGFAAGGEVGGYSGVDYSGKAGNGAKRSSGKSGGGKSSKSKDGKKADIDYTLVGYNLDGHKYTTSRAARNAALSALKGEAKLGLQINTKDLRALRAAASKSADSFATAFNKTFDDVTKLGLNRKSGLAKTLLAENAQIQRQIGNRDNLVQKLKDTTDAYNQLSQQTRDTINGAFDITGAGTVDGQTGVSGAAILAQQSQALVKVNRFVADIKALRGRVNGAYLRELIGKGPDALPQADALLKLPTSSLNQLNATEASIDRAGANLGSFAGETFYRGSLNTLSSQLRSNNAALANEVRTLTRQVKDFTDKADKRPVELFADGKKIADIVDNQHRKKARRK